MKIAIVHDAFMQWGGAENLVMAMHELWPEAPIYTAAVNEEILPQSFPKEKLITSFIQKIPLSKKLYQPLFFLQTLAFEQFDLSGYDVVLSSTTKFAKSVITSPGTLHICYCNTPTRMIWFFNQYFEQRDFPPLVKSLYRIALTPIVCTLRVHDYVAAQKVDHFIANSKNVAKRIKKFYNRDSEVIYPFVDLKKYRQIKTNDESIKTNERDNNYFLIVSRLSGHKRVDLAIEAFNQLGLPLKIIGTGSEEKKFKRLARDNIQFLGWVNEESLVKAYQNCRALIYPQEEDFGITALEAQACGKPVIAYQAGGAAETVSAGKTGIFFKPQTTEALMEAVQKFNHQEFSPQDCRDNAERFSRDSFAENLKSYITSKLENKNNATKQ